MFKDRDGANFFEIDHTDKRKETPRDHMLAAFGIGAIAVVGIALAFGLLAWRSCAVLGC